MILLTIDELVYTEGYRYPLFYRSSFIYNGYKKRWQQIMDRKEEYSSVMPGEDFIVYYLFNDILLFNYRIYSCGNKGCGYKQSLIYRNIAYTIKDGQIIPVYFNLTSNFLIPLEKIYVFYNDNLNFSYPGIYPLRKDKEYLWILVTDQIRNDLSIKKINLKTLTVEEIYSNHFSNLGFFYNLPYYWSEEYDYYGNYSYLPPLIDIDNDGKEEIILPDLSSIGKFSFFRGQILKIDFEQNKVYNLSANSIYQIVKKNFNQVFGNDSFEIFSAKKSTYIGNTHDSSYIYNPCLDLDFYIAFYNKKYLFNGFLIFEKEEYYNISDKILRILKPDERRVFILMQSFVNDYSNVAYRQKIFLKLLVFDLLVNKGQIYILNDDKSLLGINNEFLNKFNIYSGSEIVDLILEEFKVINNRIKIKLRVNTKRSDTIRPINDQISIAVDYNLNFNQRKLKTNSVEAFFIINNKKFNFFNDSKDNYNVDKVQPSFLLEF